MIRELEDVCVIKVRPELINTWIDYSFVVNSKDADKAKELLQRAHDQWFCEHFDPDYGILEYLEKSLKENEIRFESYIVFI